MGTTRSCAQLRREHEFIGGVLGGLDAIVRVRQGAAAIPPLAVSSAVEFFSVFVEGCHERKEEEGLFPLLAARGFSEAGALAVMRAEHDEACRLLGTLRARAGADLVAREALADLESYAALLRHHIVTENVDVLPLAERVLSSADDARLARTFDRIEKRTLGAGGPTAVRALGEAVTHAWRSLSAVQAESGSPLCVRAIMRPNPRAVAPEDTLARAAEVMESLGSRELPVVRRGTLVGILARCDMEPHRGHFEWTLVRSAMTTDAVTVSPDTSVPAVATLLLARGFNALPVTVDGALVGMVTHRDVLRVLAQQS